MNLEDDIFLFSGFSLAHALHCVCDLPESELLIPLMIIEHDRKRQLIRFEDETQLAALEAGKRRINEIEGNVDLWTFTREGIMRDESDQPIDTITVQAGSIDTTCQLLVMQAFRPFCSPDGFAVLPSLRVAVNECMIEDDSYIRAKKLILEGISMHPEAPKYWNDWIRNA